MVQLIAKNDHSSCSTASGVLLRLGRHPALCEAQTSKRDLKKCGTLADVKDCWEID